MVDRLTGRINTVENRTTTRRSLYSDKALDILHWAEKLAKARNSGIVESADLLRAADEYRNEQSSRIEKTNGSPP